MAVSSAPLVFVLLCVVCSIVRACNEVSVCIAAAHPAFMYDI